MRKTKAPVNHSWGYKFAKLFEHVFIAAIVLGSLGFFWNSYFDFRSKVLATYEDLGYTVENFIFIDENLYIFCKNYKQHAIDGDSLSCNCLKDIELFKIQQNMSDRFERIFNDVRSLGKLMSYQTYFEVHQLTNWNNLIVSSDKGICSSGLLAPPDAMDKWRNQILDRITAERELNKGLVYSLNNYIKYLFTDIENERHTSFQVDLKNLPIYKGKNIPS